MRLSLLLSALLLPAGSIAAQDYHFTHQIAPGGRVEIDNINGGIEVTPGSGRMAEVSVTKTVKRGDGNLVKAIMEETHDGMRVCTIYLNRDPHRTTCSGSNNDGDHDDHGDHLEIEMHYVVHLPAGARLKVDDVNGNVTVENTDAEAELSTVNGSIDFDGAAASELTTVNGHIVANLSRASWDGTMKLSTVNGGIDVTLPAGVNTDVHGSTVNGGLTTAFPITITKGWGPKSIDGTIGSGGRKLEMDTVNGGISLKKR